MIWWILGAVVAVPAGVIFGIGKTLPVKHLARARGLIHRPVDEVWDALNDFASHPAWRRDLAKSEPVEGGGERWKETSKKGEALTFETTERVRHRRLVRRIADQGLPFGGQWIFELEPSGGSATVITITEEGEVYNPIFRFVSKFVIGHHATLVGFLEDLGTKYGEAGTVEKL